MQTKVLFKDYKVVPLLCISTFVIPGCDDEYVGHHFVGSESEIAFTSNLTVAGDPWTPDQPVAVGTRLEIAAMARWVDDQDYEELMTARSARPAKTGKGGKAFPVNDTRPSYSTDQRQNNLCLPDQEFQDDPLLTVEGKVKGNIRVLSKTEGYTSGPGVAHCGSMTLIADAPTTSRVLFKGSDKDYVDVEWAIPSQVQVGAYTWEQLVYAFLGPGETLNENLDAIGRPSGSTIYVPPSDSFYLSVPILMDSEGRALGIDEGLLHCYLASEMPDEDAEPGPGMFNNCKRITSSGVPHFRLTARQKPGPERTSVVGSRDQVVWEYAGSEIGRTELLRSSVDLATEIVVSSQNISQDGPEAVWQNHIEADTDIWASASTGNLESALGILTDWHANNTMEKLDYLSFCQMSDNDRATLKSFTSITAQCSASDTPADFQSIEFARVELARPQNLGESCHYVVDPLMRLSEYGADSFNTSTFLSVHAVDEKGSILPGLVPHYECEGLAPGSFVQSSVAGNIGMYAQAVVNEDEEALALLSKSYVPQFYLQPGVDKGTVTVRIGDLEKTVIVERKKSDEKPVQLAVDASFEMRQHLAATWRDKPRARNTSGPGTVTVEAPLTEKHTTPFPRTIEELDHHPVQINDGKGGTKSFIATYWLEQDGDTIRAHAKADVDGDGIPMHISYGPNDNCDGDEALCWYTVHSPEGAR